MFNYIMYITIRDRKLLKERVLTQTKMKMYNHSNDILSITFIGDINDGSWSQRDATAEYQWYYVSAPCKMYRYIIVNCNLYLNKKREPAFIFI